MISPVRAERDLQPFDGVHDQQAQLAVEDIVFDDLLEAGSWFEYMGGVVLFEGEPVGGLPVVIQIGEEISGLAVRRTCFEQLRFVP